ncbi:hypothetical protein C8Q75DRAFT_510561 [Abortiporus biennis]|nr:hypothetical protein C8Q75DRAFT_510561 [Abortiporus biennis]
MRSCKELKDKVPNANAEVLAGRKDEEHDNDNDDDEDEDEDEEEDYSDEESDEEEEDDSSEDEEDEEEEESDEEEEEEDDDNDDDEEDEDEDEDEDSDEEEEDEEDEEEDEVLETSSSSNTIIKEFYRLIGPNGARVKKTRSAVIYGARSTVTCQWDGCHANIPTTLDGVKNHWVLYHQTKVNRHCHWRGCERNGTSFNTLWKHCEIHYGIVYRCTTCQKALSSRNGFGNHIITCSDETDQ